MENVAKRHFTWDPVHQHLLPLVINWSNTKTNGLLMTFGRYVHTPNDKVHLCKHADVIFVYTTFSLIIFVVLGLVPIFLLQSITCIQ